MHFSCVPVYNISTQRGNKVVVSHWQQCEYLKKTIQFLSIFVISNLNSKAVLYNFIEVSLAHTKT
jgi:hypothetical protein